MIPSSEMCSVVHCSTVSLRSNAASLSENDGDLLLAMHVACCCLHVYYWSTNQITNKHCNCLVSDPCICHHDPCG